MRCGFIALVVCGSGIGIGCGGGDSPPAPAHSSSFFPVRGTADNGGPASELQWVYRVNGGAPTPLPTASTVTVRYGDELFRISGMAMTTSLQGTLASTDPATPVSGTTSVQTTDHLSSDSPATVLTRAVNSNSSFTVEGMSQATHTMVMYAFGPPAEPTFFDRTDLDTLAPGFSETANVQATADITVSVTDSSGTRMLSQTDAIAMGLSWTLDATLPTFQVLGKDYANVVQVHEVNTSTDTTAGSAATVTITAWLAKGVGLIRSETTLDGPNGVQNDILDLVSTNLVGP
jgi:hypothetical protein